MKKLSLFAVLLALVTAPAARADFVDFSFSKLGLSGTGALNLEFVGEDQYRATSGYLTLTGDPFVTQATLRPYDNSNNDGSPNLSPINKFGFDDLVTPTNSANAIQGFGLLFEAAGFEISISQPDFQGGYLFRDADGPGGDSLAVTLASIRFSAIQPGIAPAPAGVPEPASLALLGLGLAGIGLAARCRRA